MSRRSRLSANHPAAPATPPEPPISLPPDTIPAPIPVPTARNTTSSNPRAAPSHRSPVTYPARSLSITTGHSSFRAINPRHDNAHAPDLLYTRIAQRHPRRLRDLLRRFSNSAPRRRPLIPRKHAAPRIHNRRRQLRAAQVDRDHVFHSAHRFSAPSRLVSDATSHLMWGSLSGCGPAFQRRQPAESRPPA